MHKSLINVLFFVSILLVISGCSSKFIKNLDLLSANVQVVDEDGQPIQGALVASKGHKKYTDKQGKIKITYKSIGKYAILVSADGYLEKGITVQVPASKIQLAKLERLKAKVEVKNTPPLGGALYELGMPAMFEGVMRNPGKETIQPLFDVHGYVFSLGAYKPGNWTEWKFSSDDKEVFVRKTYLKNEHNDQWWQLRIEEAKEKKAIIFEFLFDARDRTIIKARKKSDGGKFVKIAIDKAYYFPPQVITPDILKQVNVKKEILVINGKKLETEIANFKVKMIGEIRFWYSQEVPGAIVKSQLFQQNGDVVWTREIAGYQH